MMVILKHLVLAESEPDVEGRKVRTCFENCVNTFCGFLNNANALSQLNLHFTGHVFEYKFTIIQKFMKIFLISLFLCPKKKGESDILLFLLVILELMCKGKIGEKLQEFLN